MMSVWRGRATVVALLFGIWALARWGGDAGPEGARWDVRLVPVTLYFGAEDAAGVIPEIRWVEPGDVVPETLMLALIEGPRRKDASPTLPASTTLRSVERVGDTVVVDLGGGIVRDHSGGSAGELMTVYSVVNTLTELPDVRNVEWRVDGQRVESLVGHMDLSRPVDRNDDIIVGP